MEDSTPLDSILPMPQGPQSLPPQVPMSTFQPTNSPIPVSYKPTLPVLKYAFRGLAQYLAFFLAACIISLSAPRSLLLQHIPHTYTSGGVPSWTGVAVLGGAAVAISYVLSTLIGILV
jgi:hypothetical protein